MKGFEPKVDVGLSQSEKLSPRISLIQRSLESNHPLGDSGIDAAVGFMIIENGGDLEALLIQRAERKDDPWSGQIGLPGGRSKVSDRSIKGTVEREVAEEVGINLSQVGRELGPLAVGQPMRRSEMRVQPWVYLLSDKPPVIIGSEVRSAFWTSINHLPTSRSTTDVYIRDGWRTVECFTVEGKIVWGYTYRVLNEFLQLPGVIE
jgi:8-oxo-dGTP pyrophosphatase MutT (NUDIX family)